jgi:hypothetical protein
MLDNRDNTRIINADSIFLILIVSFGLLIFNSYFNNLSSAKKIPFSPEISIIQKSAIYSPVYRVQVFQKNFISGKDDFFLLSFIMDPLHEDKKVNQKISSLQIIWEKSKNIPFYIFHCHLFPVDRDVVPLLS